jgi:hypothetical protein
MRVDCEGCAGCCVDWRPLTEGEHDHERRGPHEPLDDVYNLVPLERDEVRAFVDAGYGDAMTPRLWTVEEGGVAVDGYRLAAIDGKPTFYVGLRKPPKPVGPFGTAPRWLSTCAFLDPETLQCRIHDDDLYPTECAEYPGHNLRLDVETECERVEAASDGDRLLDDDAPAELEGLLLGPAALGAKVFVHPDPDALAGVVERIAGREVTDADRAELVATAAASAPGMLERNEPRYEQAKAAVLDADSWVGRACERGKDRADESAADPAAVAAEEDADGAPSTPGW